ncbi:MAG: thermonuclease family protein [Actinomycetota bacterium]
MRARQRRSIAAAVVALVIAGGCVSDDPDPDAESTPPSETDGSVEANGVVDFIIDGDTIDVILDSGEERVRLIGIDTPEEGRDGEPAECFADKATAFTASLLPIGTAVRLERDVVGRDDFGRLLAYVYRADDGLFVNEAILRNGFGQPLTIEPNSTFADRFVDAAFAAEADDLGLWVSCGQR